MKKFITSFLALLTCCSLFAACNSGNKDDDSMPENSSVSSESSSGSAPDSGSEETNPHLTALNAAKDNLLGQLINQNVSVRADYQVLNSIYSFHAEETFAVTWSVNVTEGVTIKEGDNCYIVDVDETLDEDLPYVLTATITDSDGCSVNLSFDRVVEKAPQLVPVAITEKPAENTPYKLYVYQSSQQADCYFMGEMSGFYYKTSEVYTDGVDLYVEYLSDSDAFNVYFNDADGNKQYIGVQEGWNSKNSHWTFNVVYDTTAPSSFVYSTEYKTIITTVPCRSEANYSDQSAVQDSQETLYLGNYSTHMTISASKLSYAATSNVGGLVTMVDKSELGDSIKVADIKESLTVVTKHTLDKTVELPVSDERYPDAAIAWAVEEGKGATVTAEGLKLVIPETATTAKLTATITLGETTATKEFTLELGPKTVAPEDKTNAEAILAAAFNLAEGEVLPGEGYTLTGKITKVNNAWDAEYSNITVTISVNDKAIECYRLKSGAADASILKVGDTITVTGIIKNYNGKVEFDKDCTLEAYTAGEDPDTPVVPPVEDEYASMTIPQALEAADTTKVKVSGTVCEINTVWNDQFNNITVTITDADGNKLYVYRLATKVELGDIVTIKGEMATYNGRQIGAGATAEITGKDNSYVYVEMTIPEALAAADGTNVIVTGTVSEIGIAYSEQYGNISVNIVDEANNVLYLYRLSGNVEVGNVIKVRGTMATYNGNRQLTGGTYELISEGEVTPPAGGEGGEVTPPAGGEDPDTPVVDPNLPVMDEATAYKFFVAQNKVGVVYYLTGEVSTRYLATTVEPAEAVDVYAEKATGGYKFYIYVDNVKNYINIYMNESNKVSVNYAADSTCVYAYNADSNCWYTTVAEKEYYLGTYNEFNTVSASETSYINAGNTGVSQFPMEYVVATEAKAPTAAEKIAYEKAKISITTAATGAATIELDTKIAVYDDVTITWALTESAIATLENNVLTITNPDEETKVTVTATITCGDESETAVFEIVVAHKDVNAAEPTAYSVSFADKANRTEFSSSKQVWVQNGVTITNEKASSTSNVADYANPARFYKSSSLTFAAKGMVKIEITCNSSSYATALANSISDANVTVTTNDKVVTITFKAATDSWTIASLTGGQVRVDSLVVYAA